MLFLPPFGLATADVYGAVEVPDAADRRDCAALVAALAAGGDLSPHLFNRLEAPAERVEPRVPEVRAYLRAALQPAERVLLSGSGSAFCVFAKTFDRAAWLTRRGNGEGRGKALAVRMGSP